jgi:hypothetical protein
MGHLLFLMAHRRRTMVLVTPLTLQVPGLCRFGAGHKEQWYPHRCMCNSPNLHLPLIVWIRNHHCLDSVTVVEAVAAWA